MKYKGTLIVVKDCSRALKFYSDMFGLQLLQDNGGNQTAAARQLDIGRTTLWRYLNNEA